MTMSLPSRLSALAATGMATLALALGLACTGAGQTAYPAPPALTLTLQDPAEGVVVNQPTLVVKGQVSQPDAFVACNGQPISVDASGAFRAPVQLQAGANQVVVEAWRASDAAVGRGSSLLPPPEKVAARIVRNLTYQQPPLALVVTAPTDGATFSTTPIAVQGTVSDPAATVTMNGGPLPVDAGGAFQGTANLQAGANALAFVATASGGRSAAATRTVSYAPPPPSSGLTVSILTPPEGMLTNAATLAVNGTVSDAAASLTVYGQPVTAQAGGTWSLTITPPEGRITITATAVNVSGQGQDVHHIVVDRTPPRITLTRPVPALTNQPTLTIQGVVDDPTALLTLQNQALSLDASGAFTASYGLAEGPNTLYLRAVDPAGNAGRLEVATVLDTTPPIVSLVTPAEGWISNQNSVAVTGTVDDPTARVMVAGQSVTPDAQGRFTFQYTAQASGAQLLVALATDPAGNTGHATRGFTLDWTPPVLAWIDPTPAQGALVTTPSVPASATVSKPAVITLNGQPVLQQSAANGFTSAVTSAPYLVASTLALPEGPALLTLRAQDTAGNTAQIQRALEVGTTLPKVVIETPPEGVQSRDASAVLTGHVEGSDFTNPMTLALNGTAASLGADGRFNLPVTLLEGSNSFTVAAVNRFGLKGQATRTLNRFTTTFGIRLDFPLEGMATPEASTAVMGHVFRAGTTVQVNGVQAAVDPLTLKFTASVPLQPGPNLITAQGTDQAGNSGSASVRVTSAPLKPQAATYRWDLPVDGAATAVRTIPVTGQADLPGVSAVTLNGQPMALSGTGANGAFQGTITLEANGPNALILQVATMSGTTYTDRREVKFVPTLPRIQLQAPGSARPGDLVPIQVTPATGTNLVKADLSWNGRSLATVMAPWTAVSAQVPADAVVGSEIAVEAVGTDDQGAMVTARTYVAVYGAGALLVEAYDDRLGLPLTDQKTTATVEGAVPQTLDQHGRAALATALPESWIQVSRDGFSSVWRSAGLVVGGVQAVVDARLTRLNDAQAADGSGFTGSIGSGALNLVIPAGALAGATNLSMTPLSTQGLPALLPAGWSPINAWWLDLGGAPLGTPGTASLDLSALAATPSLPGDAQYAWARWDQVAHVWQVLAAPLSTATLANLPLPTAGGYALVLADPMPTMPPAPAVGSPLAGYPGTTWRDGLVATGTASPSLLATVAAINGAKVTASFSLAFNGGDALPSGTLIQTDVLESYTLIDQSVIEPDGFTQDVVASRWLLEVIDGKPALMAAGTADAPGLGLRLPVHMSRTFDPTQLVEGRILVGFYHDGVQVVSSGSSLIGASGGTVSNGGVNVILPPGAVSGSTLVRVQADAGDLTQLWPELAGQGTLAKSFQVDVVGTLASGMNLSLDALDAPPGARPLLLQRRVVQGQRLIVAAGELVQLGDPWTLTVPPGGNPVLEGGAFTVLVAAANWDWISGTALLPASVAQPLMTNLGAKARMTVVNPTEPLSQKIEEVSRETQSKATSSTRLASALSATLSESGSSGDATVADVSMDAGFVLAVSGTAGSFAVPAFSSAGAASVMVKGSRWDLGLTGTLMAVVPSAGNTLRLDMRPFLIEAVTPDEGASVAPGAVLLVATTTAMDPGSLANVRLYQTASADTPLELALRRSLSQDGRTLQLTPESPLPAGASFHLEVAGLQGQGGTLAPTLDRHFSTTAQPVIPDADLSRIQVSYPDDAYNVTVTIPAGALAPWSLVEIVASGMGSDGTGVMPTSGDLVFQMKAFLGERLAVSIQLRDGRLVTGFLGRYVAPDGRTTLGGDGGRVEGPGGLAISVPAGSLSAAVELQVQVLPQAPAVADGQLMAGELTVPGLRIVSNSPVSFAIPPVIEVPASVLPAGLNLKPRTDGNGPVAIFRTETRTLPDGTQDVYHMLQDTARLSANGSKLLSFGGLRVPDPQAGSVQIKVPASLKAVTRPASAHQAQTSVAAPVSSAKASSQKVAVAPGIAPALDIGSALLDVFLLGMPADSDPVYAYTSGTVYRNWNGSGSCGGTASAGCYGELASAEVHRYSGTLGLDEARRGRLASGRLLATCDNQGRYLNVGGPMTGAIPGQSWIALFAVDPRTGETSIDPNSPSAPDLGLPWTSRNHSIAITSQGGNPFDPTLTAPRLQARLVDVNGNARSTFAVGDTATLKLTLLTGSQPVVRGKITGAVQQDIGALPTSVPVTFSQMGSWHIDVQAWTAKPVQGGTSLDAIVTNATLLGPSAPGAPMIKTRNPNNGDTEVEPSAIIQLTFSEPVLPLKSGFSVKANGQAVDFTLLSNGQTMDGTQPAQEVWIVPTQRLGLGSTVVVTVQGLLDLDTPPSAMAADTWSFTVRGADQVGVLAGVGSFLQMVANKGLLYAVEDLGGGAPGNGRYAIRVIDASDPSNPVKGVAFGEHGSWDPTGAVYAGWASEWFPFYMHEVNGLRVAPGVTVNGKSRDLLLVLSRPGSATEPYAWENGVATDYRSRHNTVWAFDITGDAASKGPNREPKLLMYSSLGTLSDNWGKGIGNAGGVLGVIRLRGGMTLWNGDAWWNGLMGDAQTLEANGTAWNGVQVLARRARIDTGYFAPPTSLVGSNGFYDAAAEARPSVLSAVVADDANGQPIGFAAMDYTQGYLIAIDGKVGDPMAMATFSGGGPYGMDSRLHDLSPTVNNEPANVVEVLKGTWQGPSGTEQGTLLLVGATTGTSGHFWVLKPDLTNMNQPMAAQYALAILPGRITRIIPDPARMLVGVEVNGHGYIYDLKTLQPSVTTQGTTPMALVPIYDFGVSGAWTLDGGLLYTNGKVDVAVGPITAKPISLVIRNLDAPDIETWDGIPVLVNASAFFSGAFYDYTAAMLGDPNPDRTPQLSPKLMYTIIKTQQDNANTPYLRHYYPDLGERYLTATVSMNDPNRQQELYDPAKSWFMEGTGSLFVKGTEIKDSVVLEGQTVVNGQLVANTGLPQSKLSQTEFTIPEANPNSGDISYRTYKTTSAPYRFYIKQEILAQYDADLRGDKGGTSFVRLEFKLYENEAKRSCGQESGTKRLEFTVKFNSNTTLFDVVRGGAWYYDPVVSGDLPGFQGRNSLIQGSQDDWVNRQFADTSITAAFNEAVTRRLSRGKAEPVPGDSNRTAIRFQNWGLQEIQACLEQVMPALRRRTFVNQDPGSTVTERMPHLMRPTFTVHDQRKNADGTTVPWERGDIPGAFGYLTAQIVNGIQRLEREELGVSGNTKPRTIDEPSHWQHDPGMLQDDFDKQRDGRIMPVIDQRFRVKGELNNNNSLVQYWVAYPRLREQYLRPGFSWSAPLNTILTRDLVLGPTDPDHPDDVKDRKPLNEWIQAVNALPERRDYSNRGNSSFDQKVDTLFQGDWGGQRRFPELISSQDVQPLFRADRNVISIYSGQWFNTGIGILQLALHDYWGRPFDRQNPGYNPLKPNEHMMVIARKYNDSDSSLDCEISDFLLSHIKAPSIAVYVNGVLTLGVPMEEACDLLQQRIDMVSGIAKSDPFHSHIPVIGSYNETGARYGGGANLSDFDIGDVKDCLTNLKDCMSPSVATSNGDTQRLVWVMRSVARVVNNPAFEVAYLKLWELESGGVAKGRDQLMLLRQHLTLHAHSQGARISASARTRLGQIPSATPGAIALDVVSQYDYVDYGNAATLGMWWSKPTYRSHLHHINRFDFFPATIGLTIPDSTGALVDDLLHGVTLPLQFIGIDTAPAQLSLIGGIAERVSVGSDVSGDMLYSRYFKDIQQIGQHVFVMHGSTCNYTNFDNHDIINAYSCNVNGGVNQVLYSPGIYTQHPRWKWVYEGPMVCEQGDCGGVNSTTNKWWSQPKGAIVVDILGLPEGEQGFVRVSYSDADVTMRTGGGTLWKSGRLSGQDPGPMDVNASPVQVPDGRTFKPVQTVQHVQIANGVELHITVIYELVQ